MATNRNSNTTSFDKNTIGRNNEDKMATIATTGNLPPSLEMQRHVNRIVGNHGYARVPMARASEIAARAIGCSPRKALDYFYARTDKIPSTDMDAARRAAAVEQAKAAQDEFKELRSRLARLEAAFSVSDPEFYRPQIEAMRRQNGKFG